MKQNPEYPPYIECPYCYREIDLEYFVIPEPPKPPPVPSAKRRARCAAAVNYLRTRTAPYSVTAIELHKFIRDEFHVSKITACNVAKDLRKLCRDLVGYSQDHYGGNRRYWHKRYERLIRGKK
jgi:hypothetical protein